MLFENALYGFSRLPRLCNIHRICTNPMQGCCMSRPQYNLSVESNQNVESKWKSVESKMRKWGVQRLAYRTYSFDDYVTMVTFIFSFSSASGGRRPVPRPLYRNFAPGPHYGDFCGVQKILKLHYGQGWGPQAVHGSSSLTVSCSVWFESLR